MALVLSTVLYRYTVGPWDLDMNPGKLSNCRGSTEFIHLFLGDAQ